MNPECGSRERALLRRGLAAPSELVRQHTSHFSFHCLDRRCQEGHLKKKLGWQLEEEVGAGVERGHMGSSKVGPLPPLNLQLSPNSSSWKPCLACLGSQASFLESHLQTFGKWGY